MTIGAARSGPIGSSHPPKKCAWQSAPSADPHHSLVDRFNSVAAVSPGDAWAVGDYFTGEEGGPHGAFVEHWDGRHWRVAPAPVKGADLWSVSGSRRNDVWATGVPYETGQLILHWDGDRWRQVTAPLVRGGIPNAVVARAPGDAWVVGLRKRDRRIVTMTEHWNGTKWRVVASPSPGSAILNAVTAISPTDVWAAGYAGDLRSKVTRTLIEHWNGRRWTIVPSPNVRSPRGVVNNILFSIAGTSGHNVWAVGSWGSRPQGYGGRGDHALVLHWDGRRWSRSPTPAMPGRSLLSGVAARGRLAWAVGDQGLRRPLIIRWDGNRWSSVAAPSGFAFAGVTIGGAPGTLWAVGGDGRRPLAVRCLAPQLG